MLSGYIHSWLGNNFVLSYDLCQDDTGGLKLQMDTVALKNYGASLYKKNIQVILVYFFYD